MPKIFFTSTNARMWDCLTLSMVPGQFHLVGQTKKCTGEVFLYIKFEINKSEFLSILIDKHLKD